MLKKLLPPILLFPPMLTAVPSAIYQQNYTYNYTYAKNIAKSANKYIGNPYVWGGNSLTKGLDCSAFVKILIKSHTGINLPRTAKNQALKTDKYLNISTFNHLKIGDAVYFKNSEGHIHHVALVTGFDTDGYPFITHAKGKEFGIVREKISKNYVDEFFVGKRFCSSQKKNSKAYRPLLLKNL